MQHVFFDMRLTCIGLRVGKGKCALYDEFKWPIRPTLPSSFCGMQQLAVFLLFPGWDTCPMQGYPQN